jgi:hypothetical protein
LQKRRRPIPKSLLRRAPRIRRRLVRTSTPLRRRARRPPPFPIRQRFPPPNHRAQSSQCPPVRALQATSPLPAPRRPLRRLPRKRATLLSTKPGSRIEHRRRWHLRSHLRSLHPLPKRVRRSPLLRLLRRRSASQCALCRRR